MSFSPTDFIVAGPPGSTTAGPAGNVTAGDPGHVITGEPGHVPIDTRGAIIPIDPTLPHINYMIGGPTHIVAEQTGGGIINVVDLR